jgi:hypothetical protein
MDATEKKRKLLLGGALLATLIAVVMVEEDGEENVTIDTVEPIQTAKPTPQRTAKARESNTESLDIRKLGQRKFNAEAGELFVSTTWAPKQPKISLQEQAEKAAQIAKNTPPPAPTAPPLQFKYTGKAVSDNQTWVFLSQSGENLIAKIGTKINDKYRLDSINDDSITMTYLPLNIKQTLTINNKLAGNFR